MKDQIQAKILVFGRVQGVFFRKYARDKAHQIGNLHGFVRNLRDGSVEIIAEGAKSRVEALIRWCKNEGSPWSKVQEVEVEFKQPTGDLPEFRISY